MELVGRFGGSGGDLLFHALRRSTIGAEGFHGRVRDGIGCFAPRYGHQAFQKADIRSRISEPLRLCPSVRTLLFAEEASCVCLAEKGLAARLLFSDLCFLSSGLSAKLALGLS